MKMSINHRNHRNNKDKLSKNNKKKFIIGKKKTKKTNKIKKNKTINKFRIMYGGVKGGLGDDYMTIPNTGFVEEEGIEKYNQCFWISIRDYLNIYRNLDVTVGQIKRLIDLPDETDLQQMDWENRMYKEAVNLLAVLLDLRIEFYYIVTKKPVMFDVGRPYIPVPQIIVNDTGGNIVPIAFTGGHFELIHSGPNLEPLVEEPPNEGMMSLSRRIVRNRQTQGVPRKYGKKYLSRKGKHSIYVELSELTPEEKERIQSIETIEENRKLIEFYNFEITNEMSKIVEINRGITQLESSKLSNNNKRDSNIIYESQLKIHNKNITKLKKGLSKLQEEIETLSSFLGK
jgi:hypothetical protein